MRYLSLFSGIEAASCAWGALGWEPAAFSEIEPFPCRVLGARFPDVPNLGDITKITPAMLDALGKIGLIVGGSPCQDLSVAGKRQGFRGERSSLALNYVEIVSYVKPEWIVWENVPGALSTNGGMDFRVLTAALAHIGYGLAWRVLDAQFFGVPQRRRRIFLVGRLGDWRGPAQVLFEREGLPGDFEAGLGEGEEDPARPAGGAGGAGPGGGGAAAVVGNGESAWLSGRIPSLTRGGGKPGQGYPAVMEAAAVHENDRCELRVSGTAYCLNTGGGKPGQGSPVVFESHAQDSRTSPAGGNNQPLVMDDQGGRVMGFSADGKVGTLRAESHAHAHAPCVLSATAFRIGSHESEGMRSPNPVSGIREADQSCTLGAGDPSPACWQGGMAITSAAFCPEEGAKTRGIGYAEEQPPTLNTVDRHAVSSGARVRKLMPLECLRLQGFPDWWLSDVPGYSDSAAYKAIGNSMAVPCMRWIGERIQMVEERHG